MSYLSSSSIRVFPFGSPRASDPYGRTLNEQNLTQLITSLTDVNSFVIRLTNDRLEFVLAGYYFNVSYAELMAKFKKKEVYAAITLTDLDGYKYLSGGDVNDEFTGVDFVTSAPQNSSAYLHILSSDGTVPQSSYYRFNSSTIEGVPSASDYVSKEDYTSTIDGITQNVSSVSKGLENLTNEVDNIDSTIKSEQINITSLQTNVKTLETNVTTLSAEVDNIKGLENTETKEFTSTYYDRIYCGSASDVI